MKAQPGRDVEFQIRMVHPVQPHRRHHLDVQSKQHSHAGRFRTRLALACGHPRMHRVHHSIDMRENNSNFGFNLPWWDRLLGTYRPQPAAGHNGMILGVKEFREPAGLRLDRLLQPLDAVMWSSLIHSIYFKREWCAVVDAVPAELDVVRYWDLAATEKTEFNDPTGPSGSSSGAITTAATGFSMRCATGPTRAMSRDFC